MTGMMTAGPNILQCPTATTEKRTRTTDIEVDIEVDIKRCVVCLKENCTQKLNYFKVNLKGTRKRFLNVFFACCAS